MKIEDIQKHISSALPVAMAIAQEDVYKIMDEKLSDFYLEYVPSMYHRTGQLGNSVVKGEITSDSNSASAVVRFDPSTMSYDTGAKPSGEQVMEAANAGLHGAIGLYTVQGSVMVYPMSTDEVAYAHDTILKEALIKAGIPIK